MAKEKKRKLRKGDLLLICIIAVAGLLLLGFSHWRTRGAVQGAALVVTNTASDTQQVYPLNKDAVFKVEGIIGESTIEVKDGKARIASSPCPDQVCVHVFGWVEHDYQLSFCLPNQILLQVQE
ncbi:MAG: NusG domain II-containing protein [Firmicutes bacterium]|jgi:hypothetical protein|nr:NusG domain II-containing protein [Bacillota bacterium]